jgi:signal transduction histidine kinase/ABC-type uncharacterized transport system substrate-binding protein
MGHMGQNLARNLEKRRSVAVSGALLGGLLILHWAIRAGAGQADTNQTVLVLYDGGREFVGIQLIDRGIESALNGGLSNRVAVFREYMDLTRIGSTNYEQILRAFYRSKYSSNAPDVVVAVRGRPLDFLLKPGDELFPGVPIVSCGMDLRQIKEREIPSTVTGVSLEVKYWPTVSLALDLQPETEEVVFVHGSSPNDHALEALLRDELHEHEGRVKFTYLSGLSIHELLRKLSSLPSRRVIQFVSFARDGEGRSFIPNEIVARICRSANAPVYINSDDVLDCGAVGGDLISFEGLGSDSGKHALRILAGEPPASIPFARSAVRVKTLDARQLDRWRIRYARVPAGTAVLNSAPTMWEAYRWRIVGGLSLIVLQSSMIALLLLHRKRRRVAEEGLRLSDANQRAAVLEERNRMARDMHDTLAQGFTGVIVQLEAAKNAFANGSSSEGEEHNRRAGDLARHSLGEARRSIKALRPQALENADLCVALDGAMKLMTAGTSIRAEFSVQGQPRALVQSREENLLRIHQELLTNAIKHSGARVIKATLSFMAKSVQLVMEDDGIGFDPLRKSDGLGLLGIRERVHQMDGEVTVETQVGRGARIAVVLPNASG